MVYTIARTDLVQQANLINGRAVIENLEIVHGTINSLLVTTTPNTLKDSDFNLLQTQERILAATGINNVIIKINHT